MSEIESIADIQGLVRNGFSDWGTFGDVRTVEKDGLILFNYTARAQYAYRWNFFERVSRGLILNVETGAVVARGFDKFFNWMEGGRCTNASIVSVTEKMDGSLILGYYWKGDWHYATRGSFDSDQALWATEYARNNFDMSHLDVGTQNMTFLFEAIYPDNRIVVDYSGREDLVLLAARHRGDGSYLSRWLLDMIANAILSNIASIYSFNSWRDILDARERLTVNQEGFVAEFADGQRFKFKGDQYMYLQKLISGLSFKNTLKAIASGELNELIESVPDEFLHDVEEWVVKINKTVQDKVNEVEEWYARAPTADRKRFALWVNSTCPSLSVYLFKRYDNKDYVPDIYKKEFDRIDA